MALATQSTLLQEALLYLAYTSMIATTITHKALTAITVKNTNASLIYKQKGYT